MSVEAFLFLDVEADAGAGAKLARLGIEHREQAATAAVQFHQGKQNLLKSGIGMNRSGEAHRQVVQPRKRTYVRDKILILKILRDARRSPVDAGADCSH